MAERKASTPLTPALKEKATAEFTVLNSKLNDVLKQDITRIYTDSLFPDLKLLFHCGCIKTHKGILETRAPKFYKELCNRGNKQLIKQKRPLIDRLTVRLIETFIREIYTRNVLKHKEDAVVAQIKIVNCGPKEVESPESEVFVTPKASPCCDPSSPFSKQVFSPIPTLAKQVSTSSDDSVNRSQYYSLVHVEEDLSRELAEQDELSNSFRSILERHELELSNKNPTVLDFTEEVYTEYIKPTTSITEQRAKTLRVLNKQYTYTLSDNEMNRGKELKEDEVSFEAVTSGYMTGGSPRDGKEDATEVPSTEDIPHDDHSASSVSSDQGTWDSTFPNEDNTYIEKEVRNKVGAPLTPTNVDMKTKSLESEMKSPTLVSDININGMCKYESSIENNCTSKVNFFIDASSLRDLDEPIPSFLLSTNMSEPKINDSSEKQHVAQHNKSDLVVRNIDEIIVKYDSEQNNVLVGNLVRRNTYECLSNEDDIVLEDACGQSSVNIPKGDNGDKINSLTSVETNNMADEDHSPDSLNNDFPYDTFIQKSKQISSLDNYMSENSTNDISKTQNCIKIDHPQAAFNISAFSDLSNSSGPNSSLSASGLSSKREADTTDDNTTSSLKNDKTEATNRDFCLNSSNAQLSDLSAAGSDFSQTASPLMSRRRNEYAPILSGGCDVVPEEKKVKIRSANTMNTSWIVDMSDSGKSPPDSVSEVKERQRNGNSGLGFFIPLDDPYHSIDSVTSNSSERSDSANKKSDRNSSCGFYIDLKADSDSENGCKKVAEINPRPDKKMFSMFIDIGNANGKDNSPKSKPGSPFFITKKKVTNRLTAKILDKKSTSTSSDSGLDCGEPLDARLFFDSSLDQGPQSISDSSTNDSACSTKRQSFHLFSDCGESPAPRRRALPSGAKHSANRHSWNNDKKFNFEPLTIKEHKRSSSISYEENANLNFENQSGPASIDEIEDKRKKSKMQTSWHGQIKPCTELSRIIANGAKREFRERECRTRKSIDNHSDGESVDKDMSASTKSEDLNDISEITASSKGNTFVIDDVSKVVNVNSNELDLSTPSHDIVSDLSKDDTETDPAIEIKSSGSNDDLTPKQTEPISQKTSIKEEQEGSVEFVKLSDMDNQPSRMWKSQEVRSSRMTRSIPEGGGNSWLENKMLANSSSSRSLSRLFPHLYPKKTMEGSDTDVSNQSSMQSSITPSPLEMSTEGTEGSCTSGSPCSRLGEDLLRMFLDEISPDVIVDVGGRRIKAHKCILSSRCQYFAGMLSGGWVESAGNVISLQGYTYNAVHFALCHIYSGASTIPDTINIVELAMLADTLCLEGLKEVIMYTLKVKYCHFFHKPCSGCITGVLECLPLSVAYGLDEIYRKSLRWITKYFVRVWPNKGFASLPKEIQDKCYKQQIAHIGPENVLETLMGCEKLDATIPDVKWAQSILNMNRKLHEVSIKYITQHFAAVLSSDAFMRLGKEDVWTVTRLEETLMSISRSLSPDQSCQSYNRLKALLANVCREFDIWQQEYIELLTQLDISVEDCLVRQAGRAARTASWAQMDLTLRKKIQEMACLAFTPGQRASSASKMAEGKSGRLGTVSNLSAKPSLDRGQRSSGGTPVLSRSKVPPPSSSSINNINSTVTGKPTTVCKLSQPTPPNCRITKTQSPRLSQKPAAVSTIKSTSNLKSSAAQQITGVPKPKAPNKFSQVKARYLEPRPPKKEPQETTTPLQNRPRSGGRRLSGGKTISSSDSSRTSSPATTRALRSQTKPKTPPSVTGSRPIKSTTGVTGSCKIESPDGSGGNPSPSVASSQVKRTSTFRVPTKSSAAKTAQPRNISQNTLNNNSQPRHIVHSTVRSGTFLKDSPSVIRRSQARQ